MIYENLYTTIIQEKKIKQKKKIIKLNIKKNHTIQQTQNLKI